MDRQYMAAQRVAVYENAQARDAGTPTKVVSLVPYPHQGFDNFKFEGVMYPGFVDHHGHDASIRLDLTLFRRPA
jgi:hypothetical protein